MSVDALRERLGPPNHVAADQWYFGERRAPRAGETIPVYVVTVRDGQVVAKRSAPGADAVGPPP